MKKEQRQIYLDLTRLTFGYGLCNFCKYAEWSGYSSCDADLDCTHPLYDRLDTGLSSFINHAGEVWGEDKDCWGFRPCRSIDYIAKFVGIVLEGNIPHWSDTYKELIAITPSERDKEELMIG